VAIDGSGVLSDDLCSNSDDVVERPREEPSTCELRPGMASSRELSDARELRLLLLPDN